MRRAYSTKTASLLFLLWVAFAGAAIPVAAQNYPANDPRGSYYRQAFDQGFRAGQADYQARRAYNYNGALITAGGVSAVSRDYRNAFRQGYQDGYAARGGNRQSDWYYKNHQHNTDCREREGDNHDRENHDRDRNNTNWDCQERHDNGKHKGWYKKHRPKDDNENDDRDKHKEKD